MLDKIDLVANLFYRCLLGRHAAGEIDPAQVITSQIGAGFQQHVEHLCHGGRKTGKMLRKQEKAIGILNIVAPRGDFDLLLAQGSGGQSKQIANQIGHIFVIKQRWI